MPLLVAAAILGGVSSAPAQDLQGELDDKRSQLENQRDRHQVLTSDISEYTDQISQLQGEISVLRDREAQVVAELNRVKDELRAARERLRELRHQLDASIEILEQRLIAIYKQAEPDALTVILQADGFDDLVARYEYLKRIHDQDTEIVTRVRDLRTEQAETVERIEAAKAEIAAKRRELVRTRTELEARQGDLEETRAGLQSTLDQVSGNIQELEGDVSDLQSEIEAELAPSTGTPAPPTDSSASSSGLIWPVNGPITSPFCEVRAWESCHPGIDIGVPAGTPIAAAASGTVTIAAPYGGYGNYTCLDHGGGLSTCYAHQSSIGVSVGQSVSQGQTIGLVGCTGLCFGDHLHFEVRVNGSVVDPLGYL